MDVESNVSQMSPNISQLRDFRYLRPFIAVNPDGSSNLKGDEGMWLWNHVKTQDYAFDDFSRGRVEWFLYILADQRNKFFYFGNEREPSGIFYVQDPIERGNAQIHFIVWDRNFSLHRERGPANELLDYLFNDLRVHRVTGAVPSYNKLAPKFVLSFGFRFEGEWREAVLWHGKYHNVQLYGLTEEDWKAWKSRKETIQ